MSQSFKDVARSLASIAGDHNTYLALDSHGRHIAAYSMGADSGDHGLRVRLFFEFCGAASAFGADSVVQMTRRGFTTANILGQSPTTYNLDGKKIKTRPLDTEKNMELGETTSHYARLDAVETLNQDSETDSDHYLTERFATIISDMATVLDTAMPDTSVIIHLCHDRADEWIEEVDVSGGFELDDRLISVLLSTEQLTEKRVNRMHELSAVFQSQSQLDRIVA